jgi:hypothetical protein
MKAITDDTDHPQLKGGGVIPIPSLLRDALRGTHAHQRGLLFQNLRLDLQSRVSTLDDRDLIKLQGKLDYINELENFFKD